MRKDKRFTIKIEGRVFESDEEGFIDLNHVWKDFNLPNNKRPSEWRNKISEGLRQSGNLRSARKSTSYNEYNILVADERATVAYAMWISLDFYLSVMDAFISLRRGNLEEAVMLAAGTMSEEDEYLLVKFAAMKGLCFTKSCWYANIKHPNKLLTYLKSNPNWKYFAENSHGRLYATKEGIDKGYTYNCYGDWDTNKVVMRFTQKGRELLRKNNQFFNKKVEENFHKLQ